MSTTSVIDLQGLEELLGTDIKKSFKSLIGDMHFSSGTLITLTAAICVITVKDVEYEVCPSQFTKKVGSTQKITGDGFFKGPEDDIGMKIIGHFFSNSEGSTIYINDKPSKIIKNYDGLIEIIHLVP